MTMKKTIEVNGMHCANCAKAVEKALLEISEVKKAKADNEKNKAVITCSGDVANEAIKAAVEKAGFSVGVIEAKKSLFD